QKRVRECKLGYEDRHRESNPRERASSRNQSPVETFGLGGNTEPHRNEAEEHDTERLTKHEPCEHWAGYGKVEILRRDPNSGVCQRKDRQNCKRDPRVERPFQLLDR